MKLYFAALLSVLGIPAANALVHQTQIPSCSAMSSSCIQRINGMHPLQMSDGDDWHADYDASKYERPQSNDAYGESRYDNDRGGGSEERRGGGRGRGRGRGGGRGGGGRKSKGDLGPNGHDYLLSADAAPNTSQFSDADVHAMLANRLRAKFSRDFRAADNIQMELIDGGVFVHDGMKEWRADGVPYGSFHGDGGRDGTRGKGRDSQQYSKSPHSGDVEGASESLVDKLVKERTKFKMVREYEKADLVREGLRNKFNVLIDDRLKQWSVGGDFGEEHNAQRELADKFSNRGYIKSSSSLSLDEEEEEFIQNHIEARQQAKKDRNFESADKIRLDLAQRFDVTINDKQKLWSIGGLMEELGGAMGKPRGTYTRRGGGDLTAEEEEAILKMLSDRYHAKKQRNFDVADEMRDELQRIHNVKVDDRSAEWRVDTNDFVMSGVNGLSAEEVQFIDVKLKERFDFKRERNYEDADGIRDVLREKFQVQIDDRTKEWFVDAELENRAAF